MIEWIKGNRELLVPLMGMILFFILLALMGIYLQKKNQDDLKKKQQNKMYEKVEIQTSPGMDIGSAPNQDGSTFMGESKAFFLKPSAEEIISKVEGLSPAEFDSNTKEYPGLRVMWPLYFFKIAHVSGQRAELLLDVSEDGFGVLVQCDADLGKYSQLLEVEPGELLWVAGEIIGLSPEGTGFIQLATEQIRFGGTKDVPPTAIVYEEPEK